MHYNKNCNHSSLSTLQILLLLLLSGVVILIKGCTFISPTSNSNAEDHASSSYLRFLRIPENHPIGHRVSSLSVRNAYNLTLEDNNGGGDSRFFSLMSRKSLKRNHVEKDETVDLVLRKSLLDQVVDSNSNSREDLGLLKFRVVCYPLDDGETPSFLQYTIYIEDLNDHAPTFLAAPYTIRVDELTPLGLPLTSSPQPLAIKAVDLDKPNTPNSDISYTIVGGNEGGHFAFRSNKDPTLLLKRPLDYDAGDQEFILQIGASDRGVKPLSSTTTLRIIVQDNDDLPVSFTQSVYRVSIREFYPVKGTPLSPPIPLPLSPPIAAKDMDRSLDTSVRYSITGGNEEGYFTIDPSNGTLSLLKEIDREVTQGFSLELKAEQVDDRSKAGSSRVEVDVVDLNDSLPQFEVDLYNISIMENLPNGFSVLHVQASDLDEAPNNEFTYVLNDPTASFSIHPRTGWLTVRNASQLDRERRELIRLRVSAEEKVPSVLGMDKKASCSVEVHLLDANDANPTFTPSNLYKFQVPMDSEIGSVIGQVSAWDPDALPSNSKVIYSLQKSSNATSTTAEENEDLFDIDPNNGYIYLLETPLSKLHYTLLVQASDQPTNPSERRYSLAVVQIDVVKKGNSGSSQPQFIGTTTPGGGYEFWVGAHVGVGTSVGHVKVSHGFDPKHTVFDLLHSYVEGVPFAIEERTGIIAVVDSLAKYNSKGKHSNTYDFEAYVTDSRTTLTTNVTIHIVEQELQGQTQPIPSASNFNNHHKKSKKPAFSLNLPENTPPGVALTNLHSLLHLKKPDSSFILANYESRDKFAVSEDGTLVTLQNLDREVQASVPLSIIDQSSGHIYELSVKITDENDNPPTFDREEYVARVRENSQPGTPLQFDPPMKVTDADEGVNAKFIYKLRGEDRGKFLIDGITGKIVVGNTLLDREERPSYNLEVVATDSGGKVGAAKLTVQIQDVNDNAPAFSELAVTSSGSGEFERDYLLQSQSATPPPPSSAETVSADPIRIPETTVVGTKIARVHATDKDTGENGKIQYRIVSETMNNRKPVSLLKKHFSVDRLTGEISVARPLKPMEAALNISANDRGGLRAYTAVKIVVWDVNDQPPKFPLPWYSFDLPEGVYDHKPIATLSAKDEDTQTGGGVITYRIIKSESEAFSISPENGTLFAHGPIDREETPRVSLQIAARDSGEPPLESVVQVEVNILDLNDNPPVFTTPTSEFYKKIPIYRVHLEQPVVPPNTQLLTLRATDADSLSSGNGLVLYHLSNGQKTFFIDSKNGSLRNLEELENDGGGWNLTVVASDLGAGESLSSTAWVILQWRNNNNNNGSLVHEKKKKNKRLFDQEVYNFQLVGGTFTVPYYLTKMNISKAGGGGGGAEYHLFGGNRIIDNFRIGPKTGEIYIIKPLELEGMYDMLVRAFTAKKRASRFDVRQAYISDSGGSSEEDSTSSGSGGDEGERYLDYNEALIRVHVISQKEKDNKTSSNNPIDRDRQILEKSSTLLTPIIKRTKAILLDTPSTPPFVPTTTTSTTPPPIVMIITTTTPTNSTHPKTLHKSPSPQQPSYFYAGEIAVLTMSCIVFLGGLVAAISVACINKRRQRQQQQQQRRQSIFHQSGRLRRSHQPFPLEVRLQKHPSASTTTSSLNPILFPMALPNAPENDHLYKANNNKSHDFCPDCRKMRRPNNRNSRRASNNKKRVSRRNKDHCSNSSNNDSGIDDVHNNNNNCCCNWNGGGGGDFLMEDSLNSPIIHRGGNVNVHNNNNNRRKKGMTPGASRLCTGGGDVVIL